MFFTAGKFLPLTEDIAIFFVELFILTIFSAAILGERVTWDVRMAMIIGFFGAVIVIDPGFSHYGPVALLPLGAAAFFASYSVDESGARGVRFADHHAVRGRRRRKCFSRRNSRR